MGKSVTLVSVFETHLRAGLIFLSQFQDPAHGQHEMYSAPGSLDTWAEARNDGGMQLRYASAHGVHAEATSGP